MAGKLHLYGQETYHGDAWVVGDRDGLRALHSALGRALAEKPGKGCAHVAADDGEGYAVLVVRVTDEELDTLKLPYVGSDGHHPWEAGAEPDSLVSGDKYREMLSDLGEEG